MPTEYQGVLRALSNVKGPRVYFIGDGEAIKIGFASVLKQRFCNLQSGHPRILKMLGSMPGQMDTEQEMHKRFDHLRVRPDREWFHAAPDLLTFIRDHAEAHAPVAKQLSPLDEWMGWLKKQALTPAEMHWGGQVALWLRQLSTPGADLAKVATYLTAARDGFQRVRHAGVVSHQTRKNTQGTVT
jgi:hypothetical protein